MRHLIYKIFSGIYHQITRENIKPYFKKLDIMLEKHLWGYYLTLGKVKKDLKYGLSADHRVAENLNVRRKQVQWYKEECPIKGREPLVSVIVPGYNHALYLDKRLKSIYQQTYRNFEVILLDDASTDDSAAIMQSYAAKYSGRTRFFPQNMHSGNVFGQWMKGMEKARGELIWIAESDDYCENTFLEKMVRGFCFESVRIVFARCIFAQEERVVGSTKKYLKQLPLFDWDRDFVMTAHEAVRNGFSDYNLIANVSSAVFRKTPVDAEADMLCRKMKLCFDWLFYLSIIRGGSVSYVHNVSSYYRIHSKSTSLSVQRTEQYYREHEDVLSYVAGHYRISAKTIDRHMKILERHYRLLHGGKETTFCPKDCFHVKDIRKSMKDRKLTVLMCILSFQVGGGEIFPIYLANALYSCGTTVAILNFHDGEEDAEIRNLLRAEIPVIRIKNTDEMYWIIKKTGADIVHTHHAYTDEAVGCWMLNHDFSCRQVITLHGMYELMPKDVCKRVLATTGKSAAAYCYVADKNLEPFKVFGYYREDTKGRFYKVQNGDYILTQAPVSRDDIGASCDDFVITIASRGIPEKGWREAIEAVRLAALRCQRRIWLLILGDGEMKKLLEKEATDRIILMGNVSNVRSFFSISDVGMLLSTFNGESYPLSVIECLKEGRPVIVTDIGEIRREIMDGNGEPAGILISKDDKKIMVREATDAICLLSENRAMYELLRSRCAGAAEKFDMKEIAGTYLAVYKTALSTRKEM